MGCSWVIPPPSTLKRDGSIFSASKQRWQWQRRPRSPRTGRPRRHSSRRGPGLVGSPARTQAEEARLDTGGVDAANAEHRFEAVIALSAMAAVAAGCERIKNTPVPFAYTLLLHRTAWLYCFLLPFGLVDVIGFMTPFVVVIVAYTFFGLDALGDEIEEPFGLAAHHLPLDALCRTIEIGLLEALGESDLPDPLTPVNSQLT
jgi:Bestrophin, RFP-TM, chloride channel